MSELYFPQLGPGSLAQYPVARTWSKAVGVNAMESGARVVMQSTAPARVCWKLQYSQLTDAEWAPLMSLFDTVHGRFGSFTFLDPSDNLLAYSEDFTAEIWTCDPPLQTITGHVDPLGGESATLLINTGQAPQRIMQSIAGPGWFTYCFSIYLRASAACPVDVIRANATLESRRTVAVTKEWARFFSSGSLGGHDDGVRFGIELPPGASALIFGAQVEAQPAAGPYKRTLNRSGVYPNSRFDQDVLADTVEAAGHSATLLVTSTY